MSKQKKHPTDNFIFDKQMHCLSQLKINIKHLRHILDLLENKIKSEGLEAYYSHNHDGVRIAQNIWKYCNTLGVLKDMATENDQPR